ncbi:MAG: hypothetical protein Q4E10_03820, partial [Porphyromonas sp.]|nr:hypothetical protein [Porphyromonas sp.]
MARSFTLFLSVLMLPFLFACEKMDEPQEYEITVEATVTQNFDLQIDFSNKDFPETIIPSLDGITEGEEGYILYSDVIEIDPNWGSEYVDLVSLNV